MPTFLSNVVDDVLLRNVSISEYLFILPSKRACNFLKKEIKNKVKSSILLPEIASIEDFIFDLSDISLLDTTSLLFEFYSIYLSNTQQDLTEGFDSFSKWASIVLQDFNEIDRHLIDTNYIFNYLKSIDRLENWNIEKGAETALIKKHLSFFERLEVYYHRFYEHLLSKKLGYQGVQYREAFENIQNYIENNRDKQLVFVGFNALNKAEESIIKELLENELATIYWDADAYYFNDHPASVFLRNYKRGWNYYKYRAFNWVENNLTQKKNIKIIGAPKNSSQIKYVGELLSELKRNDLSYENTAMVLADESLLPAVLSSMPKAVEQINITMGYDLVNMPISSLLETLFQLHTNSKNSGNAFYYKYIIQILNHPGMNKIINSGVLNSEILRNNFIYLTTATLKGLVEKLALQFDSILFIFENWHNNAKLAINNCIDLIDLLREKTDDTLQKEFLFKNLTVLTQLQQLNTKTNYIKDIKTLHQLYKQLIKTEKLSFQGEPLSGLQLMGMLETRVLDFENVILTSANEGILPAGKSTNSFIPFDVKKEVGLPTYQERDAIFSYHFYRLIQRAKNVYLLYNTENDHYGSGEQSRFLTELEINKAEDVRKYIVSPKVAPQKIELKQIIKTQTVIDRLKELAVEGLSPTSLTNYMNDPVGFYERKVLGIKETEEAEETIAANTLGTVIHKTLETLYLPHKGKILKKEALMSMKGKTKSEVHKWFSEAYKNGDLSSGKNLLIYNVAQQFVSNFLDQELRLIENGDELKILELEYDLEAEITVDGLDFPIKLIGQADRIDEVNGIIRIIDYKTGKVEQKDLIVSDWPLITSDYKYSKSFQVLLYALLYGKMNALEFDSQSVESGIISFKNLKAGFQKVNRRSISAKDIYNFSLELKQLIAEIYNAKIPFTENENAYF